MAELPSTKTAPSAHGKAILFLGIFFVLAYLAPLGLRPMMTPDEFRYAEIPREMISSGDWISPHIVSARYFEKPAPGYQLTAAAFKVFGENAFALRLPSALAVLISAAVIYFLMWHIGKKEDAGPMLPASAAAVYLTSGLVFGVGTFAVLDSQLTAALTLCIGAFYLAWESKRTREKIILLMLAGAAAGVAFLIKGFIALAVPAVTAVPFLIWRKEWKMIFVYPWIPLLAALAVALPWSFAIHRIEPDFWNYFIVMEHWNRFSGSTYDRDPQPFWYFLPVLAGGILPAGLVWIFAWKGWSRKFFTSPFNDFLFLWFAAPFLLFSASSCKLGTYILPCFPPIAMITAVFIRGAIAEDEAFVLKMKSILLKTGGRIAIVLGCAAFAAGLFFIAVNLKWIMLPAKITDKLMLDAMYPGLKCLWLFSAAAGLAACGALMMKAGKESGTGMLKYLLLGSACAVFTVTGAVPSAPFKGKMPESGFARCIEIMPIEKDDAVFADNTSFHAVAWMLKKDIFGICGKPGELEYAFKTYPEYEGIDFTGDRKENMLSFGVPGKRVFITFRNREPQKHLPESLTALKTVSEGGVTFIRF